MTLPWVPHTLNTQHYKNHESPTLWMPHTWCFINSGRLQGMHQWLAWFSSISVFLFHVKYISTFFGNSKNWYRWQSDMLQEYSKILFYCFYLRTGSTASSSNQHGSSMEVKQEPFTCRLEGEKSLPKTTMKKKTQAFPTHPRQWSHESGGGMASTTPMKEELLNLIILYPFILA